MAAVSFKKSAGFDSKCLVKNVAFHMRGCAEQNLARAYAALHAAANGHVISQYFALNERLVADHKTGTVDIAFNAAVDLNIAGRGQRAIYDQIGADDRRRG